MSVYTVSGNRNSKNGAILLIIIIVAAFFIMSTPSITDAIGGDMDYETGESDADMGGTFSAVMYGYDENGNEIEIFEEGNVFSAFRIGEDYVTQLAIKVWWQSYGRGVVWSTLSVTGSIRIDYEYYATPTSDAPSWGLEASRSISSDVANNTEGTEFIFVLGTDICKAEHIQDGGTGYPDYWYLRVKVSVDASIFDELGLPLNGHIEFSGNVMVYWDATYTFTGGWEKTPT